MKILIASSEVYPYSKTGGLADMAGALSKFLALSKQPVEVVTPLYSGIRQAFPDLQKTNLAIDLPLGPRRVLAEVFILQPMNQLTVYFIDQPHFYNRPDLYQEHGVDYSDNPARFIFFSKCVAYLARHLPSHPEVVHLHDWQAGLVPLLMLHQRWHEAWDQSPKTCFTIHNLAYQGHFSRAAYTLTNLPFDYFQPEGLEFYGGLNCLKAGIVYADKITTVSQRYAREILTPNLGCGLEGVVRKRQEALVGILNGVDYTEWKTSSNPHLQNSYSLENMEGKTQDKVLLQEELGLPVRPDTPLFGTISRLVDQKGIDIELGALEEMLAADMQFILLGTGLPQYEEAFRNLARRFPSKVAVRIGYDPSLSHRIEAGCDFYLMPSKYEPCGLNQMYSLRYGTIPIVRATGGLDDSVVDLTEHDERATGIKFHEYSAAALAKAIRKALILYPDAELMRHFWENGMTTDFSWERTATAYLEVYRSLLEPVSTSES